MINFYELEKRCKKLQQKRLKKRILIILLLVVVVSLVSWFFINQTNKHQEKKELKKEQNKTIKRKIPVIHYSLNLQNIKEVNLSAKVEKNTLKTKNLTFDEALNSANLYYKNGNYTETIKWCKIASSLNNENEEVWKLYSLSLERLGNRTKAIKVLKTYLKYKKSTELKLILERLEK